MIRQFAKPQLCQASKALTRGFSFHPASKRNGSESGSFTSRSEKCLNTVQLLGRVGQDPKVAGSTRKVVQLSLATTSYYQSSNGASASSPGNLQSKTAWHSIAVFRPYLQEKVERYVKKGSRVLVQGSLEYSTYVDENGIQRNNVSVIPDDIIILATPERDSSQY